MTRAMVKPKSAAGYREQQMKVKRFVAENMRLALKMVKEEMGPDAVILSNKRVPGGVEILTAMEVEDGSELHNAQNPFQQAVAEAAAGQSVTGPSKLELGLEQMQIDAKQRADSMAAELARQNVQQKESLLKPSVGRVQAEATAPRQQHHNQAPRSFEAGTPTGLDAATSNTPAATDSATDQLNSADDRKRDDELENMRIELQSMRDMLEQQLSTMAWSQYHQQQPQNASLWRRLKRIGLAAPIARQLLDQLAQAPAGPEAGGKSSWQRLMIGLGRQLPTVAGDMVADGGVFAFVGPTGAGKTTTIGKLAARYVLQHGAENIALVTTDTVRIAAHEQLRTFGRILNVPVKVVDKQNSLERVLHSLRHKSLVLVDTAGFNRQDPRLQQQQASLNELANRVKSVLVIPVTSQVEVIRAAYHSYKTDNLASCVLTKLDECASLGEALSLVVEKQLAVAYSTNGQAIPNDIAVADSAGLIRLAIDLAKSIAVDDEVMADEMASVRKG